MPESNENINENNSAALDSVSDSPAEFEPFMVNDAHVVGDISPAALTLEFKLGFGKNRQDKRWPAKTMTYGAFIQGLSTHKEGDKDGPAFIQGTAIGNERRVPAIDALYVMGLDVDSGVFPEQVVEKLQRLGLTAVIYTTHSHLKRETFLLESSFNQFCRKRKIEVTPKEYPLPIVRRYLREERHWEQWITDTVEIGEVAHTAEGLGVWLNHSAMPKFRVVFPLSEPFVIAKFYGSQLDAQKLWKRKLLGLAKSLELPLDQSCLDPSRLFYLPRHAKGRPFGTWVTGGDALDFAAIPEAESNRGAAPLKRSEGHVQNSGDVFQDAGAALSREKRAHVKTNDGFDLTVWAAKTKASETFDIASLFANVAPDLIRMDQSDVKKTIECPFDNYHSNAGDPDDMGCFVQSPAPHLGSTGFVFSCSHNSCKGRDRLEFVAEAVNRGWITREDLENPDYRLLVIEETKEEKLAKLKARVESTVNADTGDSELDPLLEELAALDASAKQREGLVDLINDRREVTKPRERGKLNTRLNVFLKKATEARDSVKSADAKEKARQDIARKSGDRPILSVAGEGFMPCVEQAAKRLMELNDSEPRYFSMGGQKVIIRGDGRGGVETIPLDQKTMLTELNRVCEWVEWDDDRPKSVPCDSRIADDILYYPERDLLPLKHISYTPFFTADGELVNKAGYHAESRVYCALPPELTNLSVPEKPTPEEVADAVSLYFDDLLNDFPFNDRDGTGHASKANALALAIERYVRPMISGPVPIYLFEKPQPGTGGSLAAEVIMSSALGKVPAGRPQKTDENELRKEFTSFLMGGGAFYYIDNIRHRLEGGVWASKITLPEWEDRILGSTRNASFPNLNSTVGTGNRIRTSDEMARRAVFIRLATKGDPKKRNPNAFKHPRLMEWTLENRPKLVRAALTIIQAWIAADRPAPKNVPHFASFESYRHVLGGILENAGVNGFLANMRIAKESAFDDKRAERELCLGWFERFGDAVREIGDPEKDFAIKDGKRQTVDRSRLSLITVIREGGIDVPLNWDAPARSQMTQLALWLKDRLDEETISIAPGLDVCLEIIPKGDPRNRRGNANAYRLECVGYDPHEADWTARKLWSQWVFDWKGAAAEQETAWGGGLDWSDADEAYATKLSRAKQVVD